MCVRGLAQFDILMFDIVMFLSKGKAAALCTTVGGACVVCIKVGRARHVCVSRTLLACVSVNLRLALYVFDHWH